MAANRVQAYIGEVQGFDNQLIIQVDRWAALQAELAAGVTVVDQPALDAYFGQGNMTKATWDAIVATLDSIANFVHAPAQASKIYRLKT